MMTRPVTSIDVSTTLSFTDSAIPRELTAATSRMKMSAANTSGRSTNSLR
jgi:hypothetical protein